MEGRLLHLHQQPNLNFGVTFVKKSQSAADDGFEPFKLLTGLLTGVVNGLASDLRVGRVKLHINLQ